MAKEQVTKDQAVKDQVVKEQAVKEQVAEKTVDNSVDKQVEKSGKPSAAVTRTKQNKVEKYCLKALMNVRKGPSIEAPISTALPEGTLVDVKAVEGNWLHLTDGTFILFEGGKWAEKV